MRTLEYLKKPEVHQLLQKWYAQEEIELSEVEKVRYFTHKLLNEFAIAIKPKEAEGYYVVKLAERCLHGYQPCTLNEFFVFTLYASAIVFTNPYLDLSIDFLKKIVYYYEGQETTELGDFINELLVFNDKRND
jgi:hypothetical protein